MDQIWKDWEARMQLNTGQWIIIIVAGILIFGYIIGYYTNRQRAEKIILWLRKGLSTLGTVAIGEKLPGMATGGRLEVNQADPPLKRVEAIYILGPRENILFWFFHLLQGKGDELIVWITFPSKAEQSIEVARKGDQQFTKRLQATDKPKLNQLEPVGKLQVAAEEVHGASLVNKVRNFIEKYTAELIRLSIRPEKPHLFLRINLRIMSRLPAEEFFASLRELAG